MIGPQGLRPSHSHPRIFMHGLEAFPHCERHHQSQVCLYADSALGVQNALTCAVYQVFSDSEIAMAGTIVIIIVIHLNEETEIQKNCIAF